MAGFFALTRPHFVGQALALASLLALPVHAATTNAAPAAPASPAPMTGKPAVTPVPEDYFQRYGKILQPGTEPEHPLKLGPTPFPDVGQIKIPTQEELAMRDKLERLVTLSDEDIRQDLEKWPAFSKMSLGDEGLLLMRIQQFKDRRWQVAQKRAHDMGLLTLKPDQFQRFEKEYWDKRLQIDREMAKQFEPIFKAHETEIEEQLFREFSTPGQPVPSAPAKPAPPKVSQDAKPAKTPPAPSTPPAETPAPMQPMH
jgi:hypothetical protein